MIKVEDRYEEILPQAVLVIDNNIELLSINSNTEIETAIPISANIHPELLVRDSNCAPYKFCCAIPISCLSITLIVYYLVKYYT